MLSMAAGLAPASATSSFGYVELVLDGHPVKWGNPVAGTGATVTYTVAGAAMTFPDARNCPAIGSLDPLLARNRVARAALDNELERAFSAWSAVANIRFRRTDAASADIVIGAQATPVGRAFTNVDYRTTADASKGPRAIRQSLICLNPLTGWKVGFDGDLNVYDLRYALTHEIGHAIGLNHPGQAGELMDFRYREAFRGPQAGDIAGAVALYGPSPALALIYPPASTPSAALPDTAAAGAVTTLGLGGTR
jgi:hypothetical protein